MGEGDLPGAVPAHDQCSECGSWVWTMLTRHRLHLEISLISCSTAHREQARR
jgi:hypothetical protein